MIPIYSISHHGGEDDDAYYRAALIDEASDTSACIARDVPIAVARQSVHNHANEQGYEMYCIKGFRDRFYLKGGKFAGNVLPGGDAQTQKLPTM